jgi:tetraacyldisaccharide 4'-kinase
VILTAASSLYGTAAGWRRRWYARDPARQRHLSRPVVSVGNLCAGGSGKTPVVEQIARLLVARGERPAILTRGYARRRALDGVTVVSDGSTILAGLDTAGDEPLMLARALPGVPVLVAADRYLAGRLAERQLGATVHLLDDGFQHLALARDVDLLLVAEEDLTDRMLPAGRLREPLPAAASADALLTIAEGDGADRLRHTLGIDTMFHVRRALGEARWVSGRDSAVSRGGIAFAVAGVARPERFLADIAAAGWQVAGAIVFRDHHPFTDLDVDRIARAARAAGAGVVLTTVKDAVRFEACRVDNLPLAAVPLGVTIEPETAFRDWLVSRIHSHSLASRAHALTASVAPDSGPPR